LIHYKEIRTQRLFEELKDEISVLLINFKHRKQLKKQLWDVITEGKY
jgi:hypothetical protein